jgi:hypothetical protein
MSKLLKLKQWLTLSDTAQYLSLAFRERVTEADVLRLGLDGHLTLSVHFVNGTRARYGQLVPLEKANFLIFGRDDIAKVGGQLFKAGEPLPKHVETGLKDGSMYRVLNGIYVEPGDVLELEGTISTLHGVWDLPLLGAERLDVEHAYQRMTGGPEVTGTVLDGAFVSRKGVFAQLQERFDQPRMPEMFNDVRNRLKGIGKLSRSEEHQPKLEWDHPNNYFPAAGLPNDAPIVVRTQSLAEFHSRVSESPRDARAKPDSQDLEPGERTTLYKVGAYFARKYGYDADAKKSDATGKIQNEFERQGLTLDGKTIRSLLKAGVQRFPDDRGE